MNCPTCNSRNGIEIDLHSDGYAGNVLECTFCGSVWTSSFGRVTVINKAA